MNNDPWTIRMHIDYVANGEKYVKGKDYEVEGWLAFLLCRAGYAKRQG